jgi:hypothetical protein
MFVFSLVRQKHARGILKAVVNELMLVASLIMTLRKGMQYDFCFSPLSAVLSFKNKIENSPIYAKQAYATLWSRLAKGVYDILSVVINVSPHQNGYCDIPNCRYAHQFDELRATE